ncbi:hypothetical protein I5U42_08365 [Stenotrophomonas maltophilia]|uniref:hypothetical protein n=1 Tax=Stenotrophomonas sp. RAC2 TaxID=3064902 RepID=UPI001310B8D5|nr:hypothetical protein [Stenotrophomonas sp. RAC2]MBH1431312.1 hypothetical protein [Stenotrophomonas maltophilia]MDV9043599.1 hypothetical protein [Stenotrophomonas sp. RAC2]
MNALAPWVAWLRNLPEAQHARWRAMLNHDVFDVDFPTRADIPPEQQARWPSSRPDRCALHPLQPGLWR